MKKTVSLLLLLVFFFANCQKQGPKKGNTLIEKQDADKEVSIYPVKHATAIVQYKNKTLYIDPTDGQKAFEKYARPDIVLITDIHGDHLNLKTLKELNLTESIIIAPKAVMDKLSDIQAKQLITLNNGDSTQIDNIKVEAIPMYNLREEALKFHSKGRGNGYVITIGGERLYFSGDTEDIPEMRSLKNIDKAFVCMNLPYTMTVESAASAVLDFKPKQVYPYHYRGTNGLSDVTKFKRLVSEKNTDIEVILLKWY